MNTTTINSCCDNIADWSGDMQTRSSEVMSDNTLTGEQINEKLAANIVDGERIAEQVALIRAEIATEPTDG